LQNFYFSKGRHKRSAQTEGSLEFDIKINSLFAGKIMVSGRLPSLPHKDLIHYKDFLGEDKE